MTSGTSRPARPRPLVLVVDDDEGFREAARLDLEEHFEVVLIPDGPTALEVATRDEVDVVLLDILLAGMDGFAVMHHLRRAKPELRVIALTGLDRAATATQAMKLGAFDYVTKPFDRDELVALIFAAAETPRSRHPADGDRDTVLLVGRDVALLSALKVALRSDGDVSLASTAAGVFRHLNGRRPALAVIDDSVGWPDVIGIINTLRDRAGGCVIIVAYTPAENTVGLPCAPAHPNALIPKPYDLDAIIRTIRSALALGRRRPCAATRLSDHVVKALTYVCRHFDTATLEAAAAASGVSGGYLAHLFPAELKMTFWRYVTAVRLEIVKDLLSETTDKLEHIAERTGFGDAPHLSHVFRQHFGQTPGAYRQSTRRPARG